MVVPMQSRQRIESPERWHKALTRALTANLAYMELVGGDGAWAVSSSRDEEQGYIATAGTCTCPAGRGGDPVCCHRALVRALTGVMAIDTETQPVTCVRCNGSGVTPNDYHERYDRCDSCGGSGVKIDRRLRDVPSVQPVAAAA